MRQYYLYSGTLHLAAVFALLFLLRPGLDSKSKPTIFSVDFIGASSQPLQAPAAEAPAKSANREEPAKPQQKAPAPPPQAKIKTNDEIPLKSQPQPARAQEKIVLGKPSILKGATLPKPAAEPVREDAPQNGESQPPGGAMTAEFPNFPYPWYITQVRASLWNQWSSRMPSGGRLSAVIGFQIGGTGAVSGVKAERSSGNKLFDFAAMSAVESAAPFPPLPREYKQKTLAVHVEFKVAE